MKTLGKLMLLFVALGTVAAILYALFITMKTSASEESSLLQD